MRYRIAICGTRGVPAAYGGFETFAEELGSRLALKGYDVTVFCRTYNRIPTEQRIMYYKGMRCVNLRAIKHKYFETPLHTLSSFLSNELKHADIILLCNAANSPFAFIPRILSKPVIINVDGIERERRKWNLLGKLWYRFGEYTSVLFASGLVSDADYIKDYYKDKYKRNSSVIRYGARKIETVLLDDKQEGAFIQISRKYLQFYEKYGIIPGKYILYVSRLEPENNADKVIKAYNLLTEDIRNEFPLVVVGDAPYANDYKNSLIELAKNSNVKFLGYQFGESYEQLQTGAYMYIQATEVGGTHPALVEAMGFANAILANDVVEHVEVVNNVAHLYKFNDINDLSLKMSALIENPNLSSSLRKAAYNRASQEYSWDSIVSKYIELFDKHLKG